MTPGEDFPLVLALALGRTVEELFDGSAAFRPLSGAEYARWQRFYARHPFGPVRGDLQAAIVARAIYASGGVKASKLPKLEEFVLKMERKKRPSAEDKRRWTGQDTKDLSALLGCAYTPGPGVKDGGSEYREAEPGALGG